MIAEGIKQLFIYVYLKNLSHKAKKIQLIGENSTKNQAVKRKFKHIQSDNTKQSF